MATNNLHPRRQGREAVLQALYAYEIAEEDRNKVLQENRRKMLDAYKKEQKLSKFASSS